MIIGSFVLLFIYSIICLFITAKITEDAKDMTDEKAFRAFMNVFFWFVILPASIIRFVRKYRIDIFSSVYNYVRDTFTWTFKD